MHYAAIDGELWFWTYGASQKARNLERDPRLTVLAEGGQEYHELRGVQLIGRAEIVRDRRRVIDVGLAISAFNGSGTPGDPATADRIARAGAKRVAILLQVDRVSSWDHTKLPRWPLNRLIPPVSRAPATPTSGVRSVNGHPAAVMTSSSAPRSLPATASRRPALPT
jgi:Pyridoxamine 5''-phosphate oxidase.